MPRPSRDRAAECERLFVAAERLMQRRGGSSLVLSDVAEECGMSQSNVYRYFPSKDAFMSALADRWFAPVEAGLREIAASGDPASELIKMMLLTQYRIKRARMNANRDLFNAYLLLASGHEDVVARHAARIAAIFRTVVDDLCAAGQCRFNDVELALCLLLDMTLPIRDPRQIAYNHDTFTDARAERLADAAVVALRAAGDAAGTG